MSVFYLKLEATVGTTLEEALKEAQLLAMRLWVNIAFKFNGFPVYVNEKSDLPKLAEEYRNWCSKPAEPVTTVSQEDKTDTATAPKN